MNKQQEHLPLTAKEAAERLRMHVVTVRKHLHAGLIPGVRIKGSWRVSPETLDALLSGQLQIPTGK